MRLPISPNPRTLVSLLLALVIATFGACSGGGGGNNGGADATTASFVVTDSAGMAILGATVYLVPADDVDGSLFDATDIRDGISEDRDEPLEDAIRKFGAGYTQGVTAADGSVMLQNVMPGRYFRFIMPGPGDTEHIPGGAGCRVSWDSSTFVGTTAAMTLSSSPSATAQHVGSSACLICHPSFATQSEHAHRLGFAVPGNLGALQDDSRYPEFQDNWNMFLPGTMHTDGTVVYYSDFDSGRGFDKFKTAQTDPTPLGQTVLAKAWLWRDTNDNDKYKLTLENVATPTDPMSPWTLEVPLTYGGAVYKQRNLVKIPGRKGLYPLLQLQTEGNESRFDRGRKVFRDYHLDWFWDNANLLFKLPPITKNFDANCTGCHSTGFQRYFDSSTGEFLTHAVDDITGAYDIDSDGTPDELNLGCEVCHGPGSDHINWASNPANAGIQARFIITPENLSPSREMLMCGRCHDRQKGNGPNITDEPMNQAGEFPRPGISRQEFLADFITRKGPVASSMWGDDLHSKSHHQQYSDLLKSTMHRNNNIITTCTDCHGSHGSDAPFEHHLKYDPEDTNSMLCAKCHSTDLLTHIQAETGSTHSGNQTTCASCHMPNAAKTGSGHYGLLLGTPTGTSTDPNITYFENDVSSHLFMTVPKKNHVSVAGSVPASAMPIPYTNSCGGSCHNASSLQFDVSPSLPAYSIHFTPAEIPEDDDYGTDWSKKPERK